MHANVYARIMCASYWRGVLCNFLDVARLLIAIALKLKEPLIAAGELSMNRLV